MTLRIASTFAYVLAVGVLSGCALDGSAAIEGDDTGECADGADNDQDGSTDCDDDGCGSDVACSGDDDDTSGDDDDATADDDDDDATADDDDDSAGDDDDAVTALIGRGVLFERAAHKGDAPSCAAAAGCLDDQVKENDCIGSAFPASI